MFKDCGLPLERLLDYIDGRLTEQDRKAVDDHVAGPCAYCSSRLAWARDLVSLMRSDRLVDPPARTVARARNLIGSPAASPTVSLRHLVARVVFDSHLQPMRAGVRGQAGAVRRRMFEVGETAILDLQQEPLEGGFAVVEGQVHFKHARLREAAGAHVVLRHNKRAEASPLQVSTNAVGEFTFIQVPRGDYALSVVTRDVELVVPHLDL